MTSRRGRELPAVAHKGARQGATGNRPGACSVTFLYPYTPAPCPELQSGTDALYFAGIQATRRASCAVRMSEEAANVPHNLTHRQIVVAVNGIVADALVLDAAATLAKRDRLRVAVVHVVEVGLHLPVDADLPQEIVAGEAVLLAAERIARDRGLKADYDLLQARSVGAAIVDEAVQRHADLVILGAAVRDKYGEQTIGTVVPYVLLHARCEVWVCRAPLVAPPLVR